MKRHLSAVLCAPFLLIGCNEPNTAPAEQAVGIDTSPLSAENGIREMTLHPEIEPKPAGRDTRAIQNLSTGRPKPAAPYLETEQKFLNNHSLSGISTERILSSDSFDVIASDFERDATGNQEAQDLTQLYRKEIQLQLGQSARLATLHCGNSLCLGSILVHGDNSPYTTWSEVFFNSPRTPNYVFSETTLKRGQGFENRFVFSTDPAVNSMNAPLQKQR